MKEECQLTRHAKRWWCYLPVTFVVDVEAARTDHGGGGEEGNEFSRVEHDMKAVDVWIALLELKAVVWLNRQGYNGQSFYT